MVVEGAEGVVNYERRLLRKKASMLSEDSRYIHSVCGHILADRRHLRASILRCLLLYGFPLFVSSSRGSSRHPDNHAASSS